MTIFELMLVVCPVAGLVLGVVIGSHHGVLGALGGGVLGVLGGIVAYPLALFVFFLPYLTVGLVDRIRAWGSEKMGWKAPK